MNFKGFLKKTGFLNEDGGDETAKVSFIKNAYRKSYPNSDPAKANRPPEELWNAVLKKASYKLTQNSKEGTKKAVQFAKGARTQGTQRFQLKDKYETGKDTVQQNILDHLEDWDEKDFEKIKDQLPETFKGRGFEELKKNIKSALSYTPGEKIKKSMDDLFELIKSQESDEGLDEKAWKDKTIEDLDGLDDNDFNKIQTELNKIEGFENVTDLKSLKEAMKNKELSQDQIDALDKLLEPEQTPANQDPPAEPNQVPNGSTPPETENRDKQKQMQEMEKKRKLEKKLKDNDIPVKEDGTPDFDNPKTLEKINELMINGDDELYNEYILTKGGTQSDLAKMIADRQAKENELARTDLENRMARHEAEKDQQKAICNVAMALDIFLSFFSGKAQDGFTTLANKRVQAAALSKQFDEGMNKDAFAKEDEKIENAHKKELDSIKTWETQRMAEIEQDRATPTATQTYKRKYGELVQERDKKKKELENKEKELQAKIQTKKGSIDGLLLAFEIGDVDENNKSLQALYPREEGEDEATYVNRLKEKVKDQDKLKSEIQSQHDEIQKEVETIKTEKGKIDSDFNKASKDLESDPDVQSEFKDANAAYEFKKANIQAEMNVLRAKEQKRYEDRKSVNKQVFDERRRVLKNIATMGQWSSDPDSVFATEMQAFNKRAKELYESRGIPWNEDNDPLMSDNPDVLKQAIADYKNSLEQGGKKEQQGKGKKNDETGGKKPQRPPLGGRKPDPDPDPDPEKKTQNTGDGKKQLTQLQGEFSTKPKARKRLDAFLKEQGLDPSDPNVDDEELQDAIKEFKTKQFPEPANLNKQELENLGITDADIPDDLKTTNGITDLGKYAEYLKDSKNAAALKKLKEELGFEDTGKVTDTKPIKVPTDLAGIKKLKLGQVKIGDETKDLDNISDVDFEALKVKPEFQEFLKSVNALKAISNGRTESEKQEIEQVQDKDDKTTNTKSIGEMSLKTLWKKLNDAGISIRSLPGYKQGMSEEEKKTLIANYIKAHKEEFENWKLLTESKNLKHRKTAFKRLNEMSQAQKRASDRRTLRKFSELLVKDFRDFT